MRRETRFEMVRTFVAIGGALLLAFIIIFLVSKQPMEAIKEFLLGPISTTRHFGNIIEMMIPLTFAGLSVCIMFQAKQFNLGTSGAFFLGAVAAAIIAIKVPMPYGIHPFAAILVGGIVGGLANLLPAYLKAKWDANEMVITLMLNYVLFFLGIYIINVYLRDINAGAMVSEYLAPTSLLPKFIPKTRIHVGIFIAIFTLFFTYFFIYRTKWGYALRMTGSNIKFAEYSGINTFSVIIFSQVIGGVIAGIGGATELLGMYTRFQWQSLPSYGWDGIIVAILARNNPILVPIAAFFLAYLRIGADIMARRTDVQAEVIMVIQGIMIMLIAAESFLAHWRHRMTVKEANQSLIEGSVAAHE